MKRIFVLGAVLAGLFIFGVAGASAAGSKHKASGKTKSSKVTLTKVTCKWSISQQVPSSDQENTPGAVSGTQAGAAQCSNKKLGKGVEFDTFATDDSGNISGTWQQWFNTGSMYGKYTLVQNELNAPPSPDSFGAASYSGVMTVRNGTGVEAKSVGVGTINCATQDGVHFACVAKLKVHIPALTVAKK